MNICQRLFRFILGGLRPPSALPAPPGQVPVEEGTSRIRNNSFNSDIMVEFRHHSAGAPPQDGLISSDYDNDDEKEEEEEEEDEDEDNRSTKSKGKKSVGIMGSERDNDNDNDNDAKVRRHWPLLSVESNIDEKSEEYIERKKKAMLSNIERKKKATHDQQLQP